MKAIPDRPASRSACAVLCAIAMFFASSVSIAQQAVPDTIAQRTLACSACHGKEGRATSDGFFPRIAGKPAGYLYSQLLNFREGRRHSASMTYMVSHLSDTYLLEIANYYSGLHLPYPAAQIQNVPAAQLARGKQLALAGDASKNLPACAACHGKNLTGVAPAIPGLLGLPRDYLNAQFGSWQSGTRKAAAPDCMAQIIARMSSEDINAAAAWLASQNPPADSAPAASLPGKLPMPCGSVAHGVAR